LPNGSQRVLDHALALDVGGTKLAAAVVDRAGHSVRRGEVATPRTANARGVLDALVELAREVTAAAAVERVELVGIGSAGPLDPVAGTVSPVNIAAWRDFQLVDGVTALLELDRRPVLAGDGLCFTLGEQRFGAGIGSVALLGMVVSTGIGGGLMLDGRLYWGPSGNAGHIGHMVIEAGGTPCPCGNRGCLERYASGPAMVAFALESGWTPAAGAAADGVALVSSARAGDAIAVRALARGGEAIGQAIAIAATLVDVRQVVIGGGMSSAGDLLFAPIAASLERHAVLGYTHGVDVRPSILDRDAGLLGAAALAFDSVAASISPVGVPAQHSTREGS
jgi:glucokinase